MLSRSLLLAALVALTASPSAAQAAHNVTISTDPTSGIALNGSTWEATADDAVLNVDDLAASLNGADVTVSTGSTGTQAGVILVADDFLTDQTGTLTFNAADSTELAANVGSAGALLLGGAGIPTGPLVLDLDASIGSNNITEFSGADLGTHRLTIYGAGVISGVTGSGGITKEWPGELDLGGTNTYTGSTVVDDGELNVNGAVTGSSFVLGGGVLSGGGSVGSISGTSGGVAPDEGGTLSAGSTALSSGVTFYSRIGDSNGFGAMVPAGVLAVTGGVTLGGATFDLTTPDGPFIRDSTFKLVDNDGTDPVSGTFAGMPEGAVREIAGKHLVITYKGGDGNDVALNDAVRLTPTVGLTSSATEITAGDPVSLTAVVSGPPGAFTPTGVVQFSANGVNIGGPAPVTDGKAVVTTTPAAAGQLAITARFTSSTTEYTGKTAGPIGITVRAPAAPAAPPPPPPPPSISVSNAKVREGNPHHGKPHKLIFTITLSAPATRAVQFRWHTVALSARSGKDFKATTGGALIPVGQTTVKVVVLVIPDRKHEKNEKLKLSLYPTPDATAGRMTGIGTILDDD